METSINQRLKEELKRQTISAPELYNKIGVSKGVWSGWINAGRAIPLDKVVKILKELPKVDARWLLTGEKPAVNPVIYTPSAENHGANVEDESDWCTNKACRAQMASLQKTIDLQEELLDLYRGKKETGFADSAQFGHDTKGRKAAGM